MLFNTIQFFVFLAVVLTLFYLLRWPARKYLLLLASYYFYASWNWKFIPLLLSLTIIDYTAGRWIERLRKRWVLIASLCANIGFLAVFKYANFVGATLAWLLGRDPKSFWLNIVLPIGISFHTFQSMSYVIDVYRGDQKAIRSPLDYALFICFFPQLVSGPIVRARRFFRDLFDWHKPTELDVSEGLLNLVLGLTKKMAFADQFAKVADTYFGNLAAHPGWLPAWTGVLAFGLQIYFDFSGYTDMAIGMARLFGFHFPVNFRRPYLALSITDFWRRWHISLSQWLRDYLWYPLGANRHGPLKTFRNLMVTMLIGGLWHGARWNFVAWGGYHGLLLSLERLFPLGPFTFIAANIGWVFFRATNMTDSFHILGQMLHARKGLPIATNTHYFLALLPLVLALIEEKFSLFDRLVRGPVWAYATAMALMLFTLELFAVFDVTIPFVYFQF